MRRFTIPELIEFCQKLEGKSRLESYAIAKENGVTNKNAETLRTLLGFTTPRPERYAEDLKRRALEEIRNGASCPETAAKLGLMTQTIYNWVHRSNDDDIEFQSRQFWTPQKIRAVCLAMKRGTPNSETADLLGCTKNKICNMKVRLKAKRHIKKWLPIAEKCGIYENA